MRLVRTVALVAGFGITASAGIITYSDTLLSKTGQSCSTVC
jgi:hypothetical protein